jgi:hypothetical protein
MVLTLLRMASSWRLVHTYGVFPPHLQSGTSHGTSRWEVSEDGERWQALRYASRVSTVDERPPLPCAFLVWSRFDYLAFYDAAGLVSGPSVDFSPSTALKSAFSHRHRIAWALLNGSRAVAAKLTPMDDPLPPPHTSDHARSPTGAEDVCLERGGSVSHVRLWRTSLVPAHMVSDYERGDGGQPSCGRWSCEKSKVSLLDATSLEELRMEFGEAPHSKFLPQPLEYNAHSRGYARLARHESEGGRRWPLPQLRREDPYSVSCLFAFHLIPSRWHPSTCRMSAQRHRN